MKFDEQQREHLAHILAAIDVVFWPYKVGSRGRGGAAAALWQLRDRYQRHGVALVVGGEGDRRQTGRKVLASLERAGLIRIHRMRGLRRQVSLTPEGDGIARALCGLPTAHKSFDLLCGKISEAYADGGGHQRGFVCESRIPATVQQLLPLLVRGWLLSDCDGSGRIHYGLTPIVEANLSDDDATVHVHFEIEAADASISKNSACAALYRELIETGLENRETWLPEHPPNDLHIPLSSGL
jgi:hypothetical protein